MTPNTLSLYRVCFSHAVWVSLEKIWFFPEDMKLGELETLHCISDKSQRLLKGRLVFLFCYVFETCRQIQEAGDKQSVLRARH